MDKLKNEIIAIKNDNKTNGISKPIFEILVQNMDFKTFFRFGSRVCKTFRRFFFNSSRWRIVDLSFLGSGDANFKIYRLCGVLRAYHQEGNFIFEDDEDNNNNNDYDNNSNNSSNNNNDQNNGINSDNSHDNDNYNDNSNNNRSNKNNIFFTPYVETLILDSLDKATEECFKHINNCKIMNKIEHLSLMKTNIRSLNIFFDFEPPRNILSLALPTLNDNQALNHYKKIPNLQSLAINGLYQPVQVYRFLDSCKSLKKLDIFHSLKTFNENLSSKLMTCTQITHLRLSNIDISTDIILSLFMSLVNLENLVVHNIPQLTSACVDTALESIKNLKEFNIKFCRNANKVTESSRSLQIFDCSYCGIKNFDFPNLLSLSIGGYSLNNEDISSIFSQFVSLKYLDLSKSEITNEKLLLIFKYVGKNLQVLNLFDNRAINSETIDLILNNCPKLYKLFIDNLNLSKETISKLNSLDILLKLN